MEFFLARDALGHVELAADLAAGVEQGDRVAAPGRDRGARQAGRAGADHRHTLGHGNRAVDQLGLVRGTRVDQAAGGLVLEHVVQARLVAGNAGIDRLGPTGAGLVGPLRIGQQRARQRHHVRAAAGQDALGHVGHVDAVGGDHRHLHVRLQLGGDPGERRARHRGGDGGDACFMPADAGVDQRGAGGFDRLGLLHDFRPVAAVLDQVDQRQAVDDDEVRAARFADAAHDLHGKAHALGRIAAPAVVALVGARGDELVDQIAFRAHHFDAVIAGLARQPRAARVIGDMALHAAGGQRAGGERIDRCLLLRRCHRQGVVGIAAGMQQLQADLAAVGVHRGRHLAMRADLPRPGQFAAERLEPADHVRRKAAGDDQPHAAGSALGEVGGQAREVAGAVLQAGVHGPHQDAIAQLGEAQVQRSEQVRIGGGFGGGFGGGLGGWRHVDTLAYGSAKGAAKGPHKQGGASRHPSRFARGLRCEPRAPGHAATIGQHCAGPDALRGWLPPGQACGCRTAAGSRRTAGRSTARRRGCRRRRCRRAASR